MRYPRDETDVEPDFNPRNYRGVTKSAEQVTGPLVEFVESTEDGVEIPQRGTLYRVLLSAA